MSKYEDHLEERTWTASRVGLYRILIPGTTTVIRSKHVVFFETTYPFPTRETNANRFDDEEFEDLDYRVEKDETNSSSSP